MLSPGRWLELSPELWEGRLADQLVGLLAAAAQEGVLVAVPFLWFSAPSDLASAAAWLCSKAL